MRIPALLLLVSSLWTGLWAAPVDFVRIQPSGATSRSVRGGLLLDAAGTLLTWGDGLTLWRGGVPATLSKASFGDGGCAVTLGDSGVVLQQGEGLGSLVWVHGPDWRAEPIDTGIGMHDCLAATLFGRRGVLMIQRYAQVRFYERPAAPAARWPYREIYSIYTPSRQAGLALSDVDGDGLIDIYCGNYWIRSPAQFDLPWRLFAINLLHDLPDSATFRLREARLVEPGGPQLLISQAEMDEGIIQWHQKPADVEQQWPSRLIARLRRPHALLVRDFDGDGRADVLAGENAGPGSRLVLFLNQGGGDFTSQEAGTTPGLLELIEESPGYLVGITRGGWMRWRYRRR